MLNAFTSTNDAYDITAAFKSEEDDLGEIGTYLKHAAKSLPVSITGTLLSVFALQGFVTYLLVAAVWNRRPAMTGALLAVASLSYITWSISTYGYLFADADPVSATLKLVAPILLTVHVALSGGVFVALVAKQGDAARADEATREKLEQVMWTPVT